MEKWNSGPKILGLPATHAITQKLGGQPQSKVARGGKLAALATLPKEEKDQRL
jgi:hypothetical protein